MGHKLEQSKTINSRTDFFYYMFRNILLISVPLLIVSGLVLSHLSFHSSATSSSGTDSLSVSISSACTLSSTVNNAHDIELNAGTYASGIGKTTIKTMCNDNNGYSIYAIGYSNNEEGNNKLINTSSSQNSISTGLATSGLDSTWAMRLDNIADDPSPTPPTITNDYNATYGLVPNYYTKVAEKTSGTTDMSQGSSFTTTYSVYASSNQYVGTYNGQVKYLLTHPYNNTPIIRNNLEMAFVLAGRQKVYSDENGSYFAMQDMTSDICAAVSEIGAATAMQLVDLRDNKLYWVAKLEDSKCWMMQNLDLDIGGTNTQPLNSNNTDISTTASGSGIYTNGYSQNNGVWTWSPVSTAITSNYYLSGTTVKPSAWPTDTTAQTKPYSLEGGVGYVYSSGSSSNDTKYTTLASCATGGRTEAECKRYATGNFYNWTAAIASNNSTNIGSTAEEIATNSICPKGWRLPNASQTDNANNEFSRMLYKANITSNLSAGNDSVGYTTDGFNKLRSNPYYFVRSGNIHGGTLYDTGIVGFYWSSTASSSTNAYDLRFSGTDIYPARNSNRYSGWSVRCVAR